MSKPPLGVTMMPLGAPGISKYGSLVQPDTQIVALRAQCARIALKAPPNNLSSVILGLSEGPWHGLHWPRSYYVGPHGCSSTRLSPNDHPNPS